MFEKKATFFQQVLLLFGCFASNLEEIYSENRTVKQLRQVTKIARIAKAAVTGKNEILLIASASHPDPASLLFRHPKIQSVAERR